MSAHDDTHNFYMEAQRISQEAQFIVDSLPNAELPAVERVLHQLSAIRTILATLDDPFTDAPMINTMERYITNLIEQLENFLADPPPPAHTHIPLNATGQRGRPSYQLDLSQFIMFSSFAPLTGRKREATPVFFSHLPRVCFMGALTRRRRNPCSATSGRLENAVRTELRSSWGVASVKINTLRM
ncbi:hypothetical protein C8R46DRAFT_1092464 [Mycena filopes]|nr:hypothetical protein C8R46DRAFT_1092464 [Mycena filopes]